MNNDSGDPSVNEITSSLFSRLRKKGATSRTASRIGIHDTKQSDEPSVDIPLPITRDDAERVFVLPKVGQSIPYVSVPRKNRRHLHFFLSVLLVLFGISMCHTNENVRVVNKEPVQEVVPQKMEAQKPADTYQSPKMAANTTNQSVDTDFVAGQKPNEIRLSALQDCLMLRHYVDVDKQSLRIDGQACVSVKFSGKSFHIIGSSYQLVVFNEAPESDLSCGNLDGMNNTEEECQNFLKMHSYRDEIRIFVSEGSSFFVN